MEAICISSGHGKKIRGAAGSPIPPQLDEVNEARRVTEAVADELRALGAEVLTFHDDTSNDQSTNLHTITNWHNSHDRDLDISVHFNAFDHTAHGVEVLFVTQDELAADVSKAIADAGGFTNRGAKYRSDLYVLNNTEEPAILIEVCFCDNTSDSNKYNQNFDKICRAIALAVMGEEAEEVEPPPTEPPAEVPDAALMLFKTNHTVITCTVFGGTDDPNNSAYDNHPIGDEELGCALPYKWRDKPPPRILVRNADNNKEVMCEVVDVGPWNTDDEDYVLGDARPQAESGTDTSGRETNLAGIDLTPGAAKAIDLAGKGVVHWTFIKTSDEVA
jgi:N-acetylmuramoyl-L-alanine amidase